MALVCQNNASMQIHWQQLPLHLQCSSCQQLAMPVITSGISKTSHKCVMQAQRAPGAEVRLHAARCATDAYVKAWSDNIIISHHVHLLYHILHHNSIMTRHTSSLQSAWALKCSRVFTIWGYPYPEATCSTHWPLCMSQNGAS